MLQLPDTAKSIVTDRERFIVKFRIIVRTTIVQHELMVRSSLCRGICRFLVWSKKVRDKHPAIEHYSFLRSLSSGPRQGFRLQRHASLFINHLNSQDSNLISQGRPTVILDDDNVQKGLSTDTGFSDADRAENNRRVTGLAKLMAEVTLPAIVAMISSFWAEREMAHCMCDSRSQLDQLPELENVRGTIGALSRAENTIGDHLRLEPA